MKTLENMYETLAVKWGKDNRGKGTVHCVKPMEYQRLIVIVLQKMMNKNPKLKVFIAVDGYETRKTILDSLRANEIDTTNIIILSETYINARFKYTYDLFICVGLERYSLYVNCVACTSDFHLFIITKGVIKAEHLSEIYSKFPAVNAEINTKETTAINLSSPVEENRIGCIFSLADKEEYDKYTEFVTHCFNIFGDFDNINKARIGDNTIGMSAAEFRNKIARDNGWSDELDMTSSFDKSIDECYNPNLLLDKANLCYEIIRKRSNLCTDNEEKLHIILDIVRSNPDKKFIIISKRGEYAARVTQYLIENGIECGDFHDSIEPQVLVDNNGIPVLHKSGANKGKPRIIKSRAISSLNMKRFQDGSIKVLSIKNASSDELQISCDGWIVTSPLCDDNTALKYRFNKIIFESVPNVIYKVFLQGTIEEKQLLNSKPNRFTSISTKTVNSENFDENNCGIVCQ